MKIEQPYFGKVKEGDKIFGVIFGEGEVKRVWKDSHYTFEAEFPNGFIVPYTDEGIPGWNTKLDEQTIFYKKDIDLMELDFTPVDKILSIKKIIKLRTQGKLEARCPSGLWRNIKECPGCVVEGYLENNKLYLFRKES